jgi:hypothetical protein
MFYENGGVWRIFNENIEMVPYAFNGVYHFDVNTNSGLALIEYQYLFRYTYDYYAFNCSVTNLSNNTILLYVYITGTVKMNIPYNNSYGYILSDDDGKVYFLDISAYMRNVDLGALNSDTWGGNNILLSFNDMKLLIDTECRFTADGTFIVTTLEGTTEYKIVVDENNEVVAVPVYEYIAGPQKVITLQPINR